MGDTAEARASNLVRFVEASSRMIEYYGDSPPSETLAAHVRSVFTSDPTLVLAIWEDIMTLAKVKDRKEDQVVGVVYMSWGPLTDKRLFLRNFTTNYWTREQMIEKDNAGYVRDIGDRNRPIMFIIKNCIGQVEHIFLLDTTK